MESYQERLRISITGDNDTLFYTKEDLLVAKGYERIVIGGRGPYIEFTESQIVTENLLIPNDQQYRLKSDKVYYIEFRSMDESYVKVYYQLKEVDYADYKVGMLYISPFELKTDKLNEIISYAKKENNKTKRFF